MDVDTKTFSLQNLDPDKELELLLDPDSWTRGTKDRLGEASGSGRPHSITIHWWGDPAEHRSGRPEASLEWLKGLAANRGGTSYYLAGVETETKIVRVYQILDEKSVKWTKTSGGENSIGVEMMPFDSETPDWQVSALIDLAARVVAHLWERWPHLAGQPIRGHGDWIPSGCPGEYTKYFSEIQNKANEILEGER